MADSKVILSPEENQGTHYVLRLLSEIFDKLSKRIASSDVLHHQFNNYADWRPKSVGLPKVSERDFKKLSHQLLPGEVDDELVRERNHHIKIVLAAARRIFTNESRVLRIPSPCIVFGDIHGNITDLLTFQNYFWPLAPGHVPGRYVFLGDYVDRGWQSLEVYLYLVTMKCLYPKQFILLRGNHEVRSVNQQFSFRTECGLKFGCVEFDLYEDISNVMDVMPVCGVVDGKIFCAHGGIPYSASKLSQLESMPVNLRNPEEESDAAWEILWNDPLSDKNATIVTPFRSTADVIERNFMPNHKRGTAYFFGEKALDTFLRDNDLTHVIRAHELEKGGFDFKFKGKLITIFSSSSYQSNHNIAAVIMIQDQSIKVIQIKT